MNGSMRFLLVSTPVFLHLCFGEKDKNHTRPFAGFAHGELHPVEVPSLGAPLVKSVLYSILGHGTEFNNLVKWQLCLPYSGKVKSCPSSAPPGHLLPRGEGIVITPSP